MCFYSGTFWLPILSSLTQNFCQKTIKTFILDTGHIGLPAINVEKGSGAGEHRILNIHVNDHCILEEVSMTAIFHRGIKRQLFYVKILKQSIKKNVKMPVQAIQVHPRGLKSNQRVLPSSPVTNLRQSLSNTTVHFALLVTQTKMSLKFTF